LNTEKKKSLYDNKQAFLPFEHKPAEAQIDFGRAEFCAWLLDSAVIGVSFLVTSSEPKS